MPPSACPYLDAILFLLGISRREVELADRLEQEEEEVEDT